MGRQQHREEHRQVGRQRDHALQRQAPSRQGEAHERLGDPRQVRQKCY